MSSYLRDVQYKTANNLQARIHLHERFSTNPYGWYRWVHDRLQLFDGAKVLELGTGTGLLWIERPSSPSYDLVLTDFSKGMLETARDSLGQKASFRFALADAQAMPFRSGAFDAVVANHMLYHVEDKASAFDEIRRVLKSDGVLYAATNGPRHLKQIDELLQRFAPKSDTAVASASFDLVNGPEQLGRFFSQVKVVEYPDSLEVTDPEPLLDYTLSMIRSDDITQPEVTELRRFVQEHISKHGAFHVDKQLGMITARL